MTTDLFVISLVINMTCVSFVTCHWVLSCVLWIWGTPCAPRFSDSNSLFFLSLMTSHANGLRSSCKPLSFLHSRGSREGRGEGVQDSTNTPIRPASKLGVGTRRAGGGEGIFSFVRGCRATLILLFFLLLFFFPLPSFFHLFSMSFFLFVLWKNFLFQKQWQDRQGTLPSVNSTKKVLLKRFC